MPAPQYVADTVTIKFICTHCGQKSKNPHVKRSPWPQWGLLCSWCGAQYGWGGYEQFTEWHEKDEPKKA